MEPDFLDELLQTFLEEDAPSYLRDLQVGVQLLSKEIEPDYSQMRLAAHSLKGGAAFVQLSGLAKLTHPFEDLLEALEQQRVEDLLKVRQLIPLVVQEISLELERARTPEVNCIEPSLLQALEDLLPTELAGAGPTPALNQTANEFVIKTALEVDLKQCLHQVEQLLIEEADETAIAQGLSNLRDECQILAEVLSLPWLAQAVDSVQPEQASTSVKSVARQVVAQLQALCDQYLGHQLSESVELSPDISDNNEPLIPENTQPLVADKVSATGGLPQVPRHVRLPLKQLEQATNTVRELITVCEQQNQQQQQSEETSQRLRHVVQQFEPIQEQKLIGIGAVSARDGQLEELVLQLHEIQADVQMLNRNLRQGCEEMRQRLEELYVDLLNSQRVPFKRLVQGIRRRVRDLNRHHKSAELVVQGENVLLDQALLDQLQTPLAHLVNNVYAHGIESTAERLAKGKPEITQISLQAAVQDNQILITFSDDGCGLNLQKIHQQAIQQGLCEPHVDISNLERNCLLNFLFQPGFSTASQIDELSGRGIGLNAVQTQISRLRGRIEVITEPGQGTSFILKIPTGLNLLNLILCRVARQLIAFPTSSVLEIVPVGQQVQDYQSSAHLNWREQSVPVFPLLGSLYHPQPLDLHSLPTVGIILKGPEAPLAVLVDAIITEERQKLLKPFDDTVTVPPYFAGCIFRGTGEVVPVVLPAQLKNTESLISPVSSLTSLTTTQTILIAEDSVVTQHYLKRVFTQAGYTVLVCCDGQEALAELERSFKVDLIVSDVEMPKLNGFDLLQQIRTHPRWQDLPLGFLTSLVGDSHRQQAQKLGISFYLSKPVDSVELLSRVELVLNKKVRDTLNSIN